MVSDYDLLSLDSVTGIMKVRGDVVMLHNSWPCSSLSMPGLGLIVLGLSAWIM